MAIVNPFKAVRPSRDKVALVSSKSYEAYTHAELGAKLDFNPYSFLHIVNPDYKFLQEVSTERRFLSVHNRYEDFKRNQIFIKDKIPAFYIYERIDAQHSFCGIIGATSIADYLNGDIKKHEGTISKRERLFQKYLKIIGFNAEPILLTFKDDETIAEIITQEKKKRPEYEFSTTDKKLHKLWLVTDENITQKIRKAFAKIKTLYIADGHHRTASSALLAKDLASENENHTGNEAYNFFMSYLIPESQLDIAEFNRFVKDLNGLSLTEFLGKLSVSFTITNHGQQVYFPDKKHHFSMYVHGEFYSLYLKEDVYKFTDSLSALDAEILYRTVLNPILGIEDLSNNDRTGHSDTKKDIVSIKTKVDLGLYTVGFSLTPVTVHEMKEIADANLKMPPKTTYIQPKLRSGLTIYEF
ncbi:MULTISPECIES: DUF1015 domain-containing protein [unclassified Polaribacter]|uniref:DUF1015 domain-containing protein n=1 Tax=unclassified Polaribacter TaxID=196858 RepID=UPI0011BF6DD7|nr:MULTISPECIES: DUF1015 domain-containing protein [unclassified Polaribacter]TXD52517.1 DUF1015 domain-containing protein [Polaribacter sp. IC063]TXD60503.1 DUF1015 domain-containing protein [Polaribacter sp. IC066]